MNITVQGEQVLAGEVAPSGSKNSAVAIIPATLLFDHKVTLGNIPDITDVARLVELMDKLGSVIQWDKGTGTMTIDNSKVNFDNINMEDVGKMRGTSLLWGPMLARFKRLEFGQLPGGCTLGFRTLTPHYDAFRNLGADVYESQTGVKMDASKAHSGEVWLTEMSPTATENAIMFASGLKGVTTITGAASEPQVQDLCNFLSLAGVKIDGIGSSVVRVTGSEITKSVDFSILSDHYEIATFVIMAAVTGGEIKVNKALPSMFTYIDYILGKFGVQVTYDGNTAYVKKHQKLEICSDIGRNILTVKAQPWPGLPVDILPMFIPLALAAKGGQALFHNWMYDGGLFWTSELTKLGASIVMCDPHRVIVEGGIKLTGATMEAPYIIRPTVAMVIAGMLAKGETKIQNADALYRGHPHFSENLRKLGASIVES